MKPKVYVETSVIGYLTSWPSGDLIIAGRQKITKDWWRDASDNYELMVSELVVRECSAGDQTAIADRLAEIDTLTVITLLKDAEDLAALLLKKGAVPTSEGNDAFHIALAVVNGIDYLLTWNFKHIANASMKSKIYSVCAEAGYSPSTICTPEEL